MANLVIRSERFVELAALPRRRGLDPVRAERSWRCLPDLVYISALLDRVDDPDVRLLIRRLAASVITADGRVSADERRVYEHVLGRWRISQSMVSQAILHDPAAH